MSQVGVRFLSGRGYSQNGRVVLLPDGAKEGKMLGGYRGSRAWSVRVLSLVGHFGPGWVIFFGGSSIKWAIVGVYYLGGQGWPFWQIRRRGAAVGGGQEAKSNKQGRKVFFSEGNRPP